MSKAARLKKAVSAKITHHIGGLRTNIPAQMAVAGQDSQIDLFWTCDWSFWDLFQLIVNSLWQDIVLIGHPDLSNITLAQKVAT